MFHLKKSLLLLLLASLFATIATAQDKPIQLFGEGGGDHVKLLWVPKSWPPGVTGFQVQRRTVSGDQRGAWAIVNATPIVPELSRSKDLTNVESDQTALARLRGKLDNYFTTNKSQETSRQSYLQKLSSDPNAVKGLYLPFALDYDFALLNGFGLVDRNIPAADSYEYGLFLMLGTQRQATPTDVFFWKYGTRPNLNLPIDLKILTAGSPSRLEIRWNFDYQTYLAQNLNGFNLYRRSGTGGFQKLNETPIWASTQDNTSQLSFFDENVQPNTAYTYAVAPLSLFGTEGQRQEVLFDPSKLPPDKVEPPMLRIVEQATGNTGIRFEWDFLTASQKFIRGFVLQRRENVEAAYADVSQQLPASARAATDTPPKQGEYYLYRLRVVDDFGGNLFSNELLVFYDPQVPPPAPTGLRGEFEKEGNRQFIRLSWNPKSQGDTLTTGYWLYSNFPPSERLILEGNIPTITANGYRYEIFSAKSEAYQFAVSAVGARTVESGLSNVVRVVTPSQIIPNTNIWPFSVNGNRITLNWAYDAPPDLAGFRIFQDGTQVAGEAQLGASARQWVSPPLAFNATYNFELQAVTTTGVVSKKSIARTITTGKEQ
ncbi:MAG: hypothetical protein IPM82_25390 [Saprospiraceae bacterium]|nr:hypothetical protein [Saprospiraceae bacterium]